ncbi:amidohydrolase family protein, partial [bacterium]|nr:amidohydrolase family protein [bacterium]
ADVRSLLAELTPPLTLRGYREVLGWEPAARERALAGARAALAAAPPPVLAAPGALLAGLSPHAPYSSHPALVTACFDLARESALPVAMHLAESEAERRFLDAASGPFADLHARLGWTEPAAWSAAAPDGLGEWLASVPLAAPLLLVHGTWLEPAEIARLAARPATAIAYCPGSVPWFHGGADPHPVVAMLAAGLPVALGTDSLASSPTLNLPLTCTLARRAQPALGPEQILWMATRAGALALGCPERGELTAGGPADFVAFDLAGSRGGRRGALEAIEGALLSGYRVPGLSVIGGIAHAFAALRPFPA